MEEKKLFCYSCHRILSVEKFPLDENGKRICFCGNKYLIDSWYLEEEDAIICQECGERLALRGEVLCEICWFAEVISLL